MAARNYDLVMVNGDAVKKDLERFGLEMKDLSRKMGKNDAFISATIRRGKVTRDLVEGIEDALFADRGKYTIELVEAQEEPPKPQMTEGMGILLKQIVGAVNALSENVDTLDKTEELVKVIKEANEANLTVLQEILQKQKEMTTLAARILSNMERRQS